MKQLSARTLCLVTGSLLALGASDADALNITRNFTGGAAPGNAVGGGTLVSIFNAAADWWEIAIADNHNLTLNFAWTALGGPSLGAHSLVAQTGGPASRETVGNIVFDNDGTSVFFLDPTPRLNEEYTAQPIVFTDLGGGSMSTSRSFTGGTGFAAGRIDLFTVALHEIGHALGLSSANQAYQFETGPDNNITVGPGRPFIGSVIPTNNSGAPAPPASFNAHVNIAGALMFPSVGPSLRRYGSAVDILANAQVSNFTILDLSPDFAPAAIPEPATLALFGLGLLGLVGVRRRRRRSA